MSKMYQRHLGDGVYVSFDGYHINIAVNHHNNHVVALEPSVVDSFIQYSKELREHIQEGVELDISAMENNENLEQ